MEYSEYEYKHFSMAKTARNFAFLAVITALFRTLIFPFIFGSLALIFAILSKGNTKAYTFGAKVAILLSVCTLIGNTALTAYTIYDVSTNPKYVQELDSACEQLYGMSWEEYSAKLTESFQE